MGWTSARSRGGTDGAYHCTRPWTFKGTHRPLRPGPGRAHGPCGFARRDSIPCCSSSHAEVAEHAFVASGDVETERPGRRRRRLCRSDLAAIDECPDGGVIHLHGQTIRGRRANPRGGIAAPRQRQFLAVGEVNDDRVLTGAVEREADEVRRFVRAEADADGARSCALPEAGRELDTIPPCHLRVTIEVLNAGRHSGTHVDDRTAIAVTHGAAPAISVCSNTTAPDSPMNAPSCELAAPEADRLVRRTTAQQVFAVIDR